MIPRPFSLFHATHSLSRSLCCCAGPGGGLSTLRRRAKLALGTNRRDADPHRGRDTKTWNIVSGDLVQVIAGPEKGRQGKVMRVDRAHERVYVEGLNVRRLRTGASLRREGKMVTKEAGIPVGAVGLVDPKTNALTKFNVKELPNGIRVRVAKETGTLIHKPTPVRKLEAKLLRIQWREELNTPVGAAQAVTRPGGPLPIARLYGNSR